MIVRFSKRGKGKKIRRGGAGWRSMKRKPSSRFDEDNATFIMAYPCLGKDSGRAR